MAIKVGKIPYLNSALFYFLFERGADASAAGEAVELVPLVPRQLSGAVVEDGVDAGPVPLVTCWEIEDRYEPLGEHCIATADKARSILFFSKRPFKALDGARVGVTAETSTSVRLLKVLMAHYYAVKPRAWVHVDWPNNDAFLLIGDEALIHRRGVKDYPHVADLGEVWRAWTGLPFVFARWMVRRDLDGKVKKALERGLARSVGEGRKQLDDIVEPRARDLGMTTAEMREYLDGFTFSAGDAERAAMDRFRQLDAATTGVGT
jgi:chorismate dehydratase